MALVKQVQEPWFSLISLGLKKCEGRLYKGDFRNINKGDVITFTNTDLPFKRRVDVKVTSVHMYKSFSEYLTKEGLDKCLPGIDTIEHGVAVYRAFYSQEDEEKYGIIAIRLQVIG